MSTPQWLLVDVLDDGRPFVVAVGDIPKKRVPLASFLRSDDRSSALSAVREVRAMNRMVELSSRGKSVVAEPIAEDVSGVVHGVWLRLGYGSPDSSCKPSAWAFTWDLDTGSGRRSAIVGGGQSWSSMGVDQNYSFAEGLSKLELGSDKVGVLADVIEGMPGRVLQLRGVERRPDADDRELQIIARFGCTGGDHSPRRGVLRGISLDLGSAAMLSAECSANASVAEAVARSMRRSGEHRAVLDPETLVLLHWDGEAPENILWQRFDLDAGGAFVHPDDAEMVRSTARGMEESTGSRGSSVRLRIRDGGGYVEMTASMHTVGLSDAVTAILLVFDELAVEHAS